MVDEVEQLGAMQMKVGVAYAVPVGSPKAHLWHDGFTAAMQHLGARHEIRWWNVLEEEPSVKRAAGILKDLDAILVKSSWQGTPDRALRRHLARHPSLPSVILVSGSGPPRRFDSGRYDVVLYQTTWYRKFIPGGQRSFRAFGIDTNVMTPGSSLTQKDIDWLFVGIPVAYKRPLKLLEHTGSRVVVGDLTGLHNSDIVRVLSEAGVEIVDFTGYEELANYYRRARNVLIPTELHGGGERALLEALACGAEVHISPDNPKLAGLLDEAKQHIPTHLDYAAGIEAGLMAAYEQPSSRYEKLVSHAMSEIAALQDGSRAQAGRLRRSASGSLFPSHFPLGSRGNQAPSHE